MKISILIERLEKLKVEHGDIECFAFFNSAVKIIGVSYEERLEQALSTDDANRPAIIIG